MTTPPDFPPFDESTSDGCTLVLDWARHCCVEHDREYWEGRTDDDRARADKALRVCIQAHGPWWSRPFYWSLGWVRWSGVRVLPVASRAFWDKPHKRGLR